MRLSSVVALALLKTVAGHTVFTTLFVNDVDQGDGTCVRMPSTPANATDPINNLASNDMACGYDGTVGVARVCPVDQSSKLSFLFREWADGSQPGAIDVSHLGPCAVYMKAVDSAINDTAVGDGWFKIWEDGYDETTSQWCTQKLIQNNGFLSVDVPSDLAGGHYLVRPEVLALHQADKTPPNPQFYVGCAQIFLNSTATSVPKDTVSIPGYVNISNPSVLFNVWTPKFPYPEFGPEVYTSGQASTSNAKLLASGSTDSARNEGLLPQYVVLTNANWWGTEVQSYSTEDGCWQASKQCWDQATTCYSTAPPTGSKNCPIWETKCNGIDDACNSNNFNGPPNAGSDLTPPVSSYASIPAASTVAPGSEAPTTSTPSSESPTTTSSLKPTSAPSTSSSSTVTSSSDTKVSEDGSCAGTTAQICSGSQFGDCCSAHGYCGSTSDYCDDGCQSGFGDCGNSYKRHIVHSRFAHSHIKHGHHEK